MPLRKKRRAAKAMQKKRKPGRPPKPEDEKAIRLTLSLTGREKRMVLARARKSKIRPTTALRRILMRALGLE